MKTFNDIEREVNKIIGEKWSLMEEIETIRIPTQKQVTDLVWHRFTDSISADCRNRFLDNVFMKIENLSQSEGYAEYAFVEYFGDKTEKVAAFRIQFSQKYKTGVTKCVFANKDIDVDTIVRNALENFKNTSAIKTWANIPDKEKYEFLTCSYMGFKAPCPCCGSMGLYTWDSGYDNGNCTHVECCDCEWRMPETTYGRFDTADTFIKKSFMEARQKCDKELSEACNIKSICIDFLDSIKEIPPTSPYSCELLKAKDSVLNMLHSAEDVIKTHY